METSVTFKSDLFKPFLPNGFQVKPGSYRAELAWWLTRELSKKAIFTTYPNFEDWGWYIGFPQMKMNIGSVVAMSTP